MKRKPAKRTAPTRRPTTGELNARQRAFVVAFLATGNATEAAKRAGYAAASAPQRGVRLMKVKGVAAAIKAGQAENERKVGLSRDERLQLLADFAQGHAKSARGKAVSVAVKERLKAIELIGRMCGDFSETRKHEGEIAVTKGDALVLLRERLQSDPGVRARVLEVMGGSGNAG